jgi:uncharacterized protein
MADYEADLQKERDMKNQFMARHPESPFIVGEAGGFHGLPYFPIDPSYRVSAVLERVDAPREAFLRTNRDGQLTCRYIGDLKFTLHGRELQLRVFHAGEQVGPSVFVPFRDATCGHESYGAGRYLTLQLTEDDRYTLDFNLAFNPYCAYTDRFECGFPPAENDLPVAVRAGEMGWTDSESAGTDRVPTPTLVRSPKKGASTGRPRGAAANRRASRSKSQKGIAGKSTRFRR